MDKNFEENLPSGYKQAYHFNAKDVKAGVIMNVVALVVLVAVVLLAAIPLIINGFEFGLELYQLSIAFLVWIVAMVVYVILHELLHGATYKALTHRKLTFGLSWSCAFCGVPDIYVYRKTAILALLMPFLVFTLVFVPLTVWLYFVNHSLYMLAAALLGIHWGGCSGDLYMLGLLSFKFRDSSVLMRDTGPEQFIYITEKI